MRLELQRLHDELTEVGAEVAAVDDTAALATNGWTVAQVLEHLAKSHRAAVPRFEAALDGAAPPVGEERVRYRLLERMLVAGMAGRTPFRIPVPKAFEPGPAGLEAKAACLDSIHALLGVVERADGCALAGLRVVSPIAESLRLGFLPYLDGVVQHARYHRAQLPDPARNPG